MAERRVFPSGIAFTPLSADRSVLEVRGRILPVLADAILVGLNLAHWCVILCAVGCGNVGLARNNDVGQTTCMDSGLAVAPCVRWHHVRCGTHQGGDVLCQFVVAPHREAIGSPHIGARDGVVVAHGRRKGAWSVESSLLCTCAAFDDAHWGHGLLMCLHKYGECSDCHDWPPAAHSFGSPVHCLGTAETEGSWAQDMRLIQRHRFTSHMCGVTCGVSPARRNGCSQECHSSG